MADCRMSFAVDFENAIRCRVSQRSATHHSIPRPFSGSRYADPPYTKVNCVTRRPMANSGNSLAIDHPSFLIERRIDEDLTSGIHRLVSVGLQRRFHMTIHVQT